jgi:hypothetical protein
MTTTAEQTASAELEAFEKAYRDQENLGVTDTIGGSEWRCHLARFVKHKLGLRGSAAEGYLYEVLTHVEFIDKWVEDHDGRMTPTAYGWQEQAYVEEEREQQDRVAQMAADLVADAENVLDPNNEEMF